MDSTFSTHDFDRKNSRIEAFARALNAVFSSTMFVIGHLVFQLEVK
jgi:hypothetical protein